MSDSELISPDWQSAAKLIGYGIDSLVFHPPFFLPNDPIRPQLNEKIRKSPDAFVGMVTTQDSYQNARSRTTKILKALLSQNSGLCRLTVLPELISSGLDVIHLKEEQVRALMDQHHAVRKRVEYEGSWKGKGLVYLIYPYAGLPLAKLCSHPESAPGWNDLFTGLLEVVRFVRDLHDQGYVHGDLSPNNLLYDERKPQRFTVVDWNMLCRSDEFLHHTKGSTRVACWSPEHFSLTTERLSEVEPEKHWHIYAAEMQNYLQRMITFSGSFKTQNKLQEFFGTLLSGFPPEYEKMYRHLRNLTGTDPSVIGKYHDLRYLADTIAKAVHAMYINRTNMQRTAYNCFLAILLSQNHPNRSADLENPTRFTEKLSTVLEACCHAGANRAEVRALELNTMERTLFHLLQNESEK